MREKLQHIVFPEQEALVPYREMFYRGDRGVLTGEPGKSRLCLGKFDSVEFNTYLNGVSYGKWRQYTDIKNVYVHLDVEGLCEITLCGYHLENDVPVRTVLGKRQVNARERTVVCMEYPPNKEQILGFELTTFGEVTIFGGYYEGEFGEENVRKVELALATTTCWKEEYIKENIRYLKEGILDLDEEIGSHFKIHIVDNGRTLKREDFPDDERICYYPNKNTGGSGGYARGMIESRHQNPRATHVLLMDDDVVVLPDSIFRMYVLLKHIKESYKESFVSGAMLLLEEKNIQHEDIGTVDDMGTFVPLKPRWNHFVMYDNLHNESGYKRKNMYQAWWYCCIPMNVINKNGLPLPLFIRGDDVEYSLRCKADIISMNGIFVWHMGFYGKYSASMNLYQEIRNLMIGQAASDVYQNVNLIRRIKIFYRDNMLKHDYDAAELILRAFEDYMKGPEFIMKDKGEAILKANGKLNQKLIPLEELETHTLDVYGDPYWDMPRKFIKKWIYRLTYNGHQFWPEKFLVKEPVIIPFDFGYTPGKMAMRKTYIAVNPVQKTGCVKELNKKRFRQLQRRYYKDMGYYKKNDKTIRKRYRQAQKTLTSEEFWRGYLEI